MVHGNSFFPFPNPSSCSGIVIFLSGREILYSRMIFLSSGKALRDSGQTAASLLIFRSQRRVGPVKRSSRSAEPPQAIQPNAGQQAMTRPPQTNRRGQTCGGLSTAQLVIHCTGSAHINPPCGLCLRLRRDNAFNPILVMTQADITADLTIPPGRPDWTLRICP